MPKERLFPAAMNLIIVLLLSSASAVLAYGQEESARQGDQCAEKLASIKRLEANASEISQKIPTTKGKEQQLLLKQMEQIWPQMVEIIKSMRSLGCPNTPDMPISGSRSGGAMPGVEGPGGEGAAEYEEGPELRHLAFRDFIAKEQPGEQEADGRCGNLAGRWQIKTPEDSSTWEFWKIDYPRVYGGRGHGGYATLLAALKQGNVLRLQFDLMTKDGGLAFGGTFTCQLDADCQASLSPCKLTYDRNRTGSVKATFKRLQE